MEWRDQGILLSSQTHGESAAIIEVLTPEHGRHAGVVRGGASRRMAPVLQPGAQLDVAWRARLEDHIGTYSVELIRSRAALTMSNRLALSGLNAITALLRFCLPEREAHPGLYSQTVTLLDMMQDMQLWPLTYLHWELALLNELGFGLDLTECAVLGQGANDLSFVSPRTGRAVSRAGAGQWADRLLPLPECLLMVTEAPDQDVLAGLAVTGHFLHHHMAPELAGKPLPDQRQRMIDRLTARASL